MAKIFKQTDGAPIGMRLACAVARIVMGMFDRKLAVVCKEQRLEIQERFRYMDDVRKFMNGIRLGWRWNGNRMEYRRLWEREEVTSGMTEEGKTAEVMLAIMNSIFPFLTFEMEHPEQFPGGRLPTLDFQCWVEGNRVKYLFFQKAMAKKTLIHRNSALGENVKVASMTQNLVRRMLNTSEDVDFKERIKVIDEYSDQLRASGYSPEQAQRIVVAGLTGYERKLKKSTEEKIDLHRSAAGSLESRIKKKLLGRQTWYKNKKRDARAGKNSFKSSSKRKPNHKSKLKNDSPPEVVTVMFVPQTPNGELAKRLQQVENDIAKVTGKKVRMVERSGTMIRRLLCRSNPWAGGKCGRDNCLSCLNGPDNQNCFAKNILYEIKCLDCEEVSESVQSVLYIGESSRTAFCRSSEHLKGYQKGITSSPLHKHSIEKHKGSKKVKFQFKVVKQFFTALSRMVAESVRIARRSEVSSNILLNSKGEYNRCKLPRLTVDGGGGEGDRKYSFNSPALDAGHDKDIRESKVCKRTLKQEISSLDDKCTLSQSGFQSATSGNILSSCSQQQMKVKKRKRGST